MSSYMMETYLNGVSRPRNMIILGLSCHVILQNPDEAPRLLGCFETYLYTIHTIHRLNMGSIYISIDSALNMPLQTPFTDCVPT